MRTPEDDLQEVIRLLEARREGLVKRAGTPLQEAILGPVVEMLDQAVALARRDLEAFQRASGEAPRLTVNTRSGKVKGVTSAQRQSVSEKMLRKEPEWMRYARKAKPPLPSMGAVAKALGVSTSFISQVNSGKKVMSPELAAKFEKLTGYPVSRWRR